MFTRSVKLFDLFGFAIKVDGSWIFLALLVTWTLADSLFPQLLPGQPTGLYWTMGAAGALGLFASIIFHELAHAIVARVYGIPIKGITLFIFGGVAEMEDEPPNPKSEFLMAIAGPIASLILAAAAFAVLLVLPTGNGASPVASVLSYIMQINAILAVFNMIPAFPLDGGRVLRAVLWAFRGKLRPATRIASLIGGGFGFLLIVLGVLSVVGGNFVGGLWMVMIGMFMRGASEMSYRQLIVRRALEGEKVRRFMKTDPVTVPPLLPVRALVEDYIYKYHFKMYPVTDNGRLIGCVTTRDVRNLAPDEWDEYTVREIMGACGCENTVAPDEDAMKALMMMSQNASSRLLVVEDGQLAGILALKDLLGFLSLKIDLEGQAKRDE